MVVKENVDLSLRLQRLCELVEDAAQKGLGHNARHTSPTVLMDTARAYSAILGETASLTVASDDTEVVRQALRLGALLITVISHNSDEETLTIEAYEWISKCTLDGLERVVLFFSSGSLKACEFRDELISVVRLLVGSFAQERHLCLHANSATLESSIPIIEGCKIMLRSQHALMDRRLWCAQLLVKRGLCCSRDVERLFLPSNRYDKVLQRFFLQTLQNEFTTMRRHADGLLTITDIAPGWCMERTDDTDYSTNYFYYYAPLTVPGNRAATRCGRSASTPSMFSTSSTTPRSRFPVEDSGRQLRGGNARGNTPQRVASKNSAAVQCSLTVLAALGVAEGGRTGGDAVLRELCDETSDFVDFVGDLVSVCAVVTRPFLMEQLEAMEQMCREASLVLQNGQTSQENYLCLREDLVKYRRYIQVVEQFICCWDPSSLSSSFSSTRPSFPQETLTHLSEFAVPGRNPEKEEKRGKSEDRMMKIDQQAALEADLAKKDTGKPQWEPVAPALKAHLASANLYDGMMTWSDVVLLVTEVKRFRETERAALWSYWMQQRKKTILLAAEVTCMQQRCNALLEMKGILSSLKASSMDDLKRKWKDGICQRVQELEETFQRDD